MEIKTESVGFDDNGKVAIRTKNFGTVYRGNKPGELDTFEMTDSQIKKLKTFMESGGSEEDFADSTFGRGDWMIVVSLIAAVAVVILVFLRRTRHDSGSLSIK